MKDRGRTEAAAESWGEPNFYPIAEDPVIRYLGTMDKQLGLRLSGLDSVRETFQSRPDDPNATQYVLDAEADIAQYLLDNGIMRTLLPEDRP